ncbi:hypothetical protein DF3PB_2950006 [uncultured Defluviicoccus sp.]|uniref:Uncharacterized protein n=1 Tax=metagenome TaxID=256318 RepID=A0A380TEG4_9ZZZZ|nr:hypothetical protein DF3PB_2950006 [uncultured Defluviicoccus sp.]
MRAFIWVRASARNHKIVRGSTLTHCRIGVYGSGGGSHRKAFGGAWAQGAASSFANSTSARRWISSRTTAKSGSVASAMRDASVAESARRRASGIRPARMSWRRSSSCCSTSAPCRSALRRVSCCGSFSTSCTASRPSMTAIPAGAKTCPASPSASADRWSANGLPAADDTLPRRAVSILRLALTPLVRIGRILVMGKTVVTQCRRCRLNSALRNAPARSGAAQRQK